MLQKNFDNPLKNVMEFPTYNTVFIKSDLKVKNNQYNHMDIFYLTLKQ